MTLKEDAKWLSWGRQKQAVLQVIIRPMAPAEILREAKQINPKISFGDTSNIIREFEKRNIVKCLTPERKTGRIYFLTNYGRRLVWRCWGVKIDGEPLDFNWDKYAHIVAGASRKHLLLELYCLRGFYPDGVNLALIRKRLNRVHPITLSQTFTAVQSLLDEKLIEIGGYARKRNSKLYKLTAAGLKISEYFHHLSQQKHDYAF